MDNNIIQLYENINHNINNLNSDNAKELLELIKKDFLKMMEDIKLFLISERNTYYGYFLMNMKFTVDFKSSKIAGIVLNTMPPEFCANPLNLCRFSLKEIIYITCHEIDHLVLNHPGEMVKVNPAKDDKIYYKFNLACDAAVNDRLNHEIKNKSNYFMSEPEGIITSKVLKEMFKLSKIEPLESYAYYYNLIKDLECDEQYNGQERMINNKASNLNNSDNYQINDGDKIIDHNWSNDEDNEDLSDFVKEYLNQVDKLINPSVRGSLPSYFIENIEKNKQEPKLSWKQILKKYFGTITAGKVHTRTRLNRRQPERFDLSGKIDEKVLKIVIAVDTSGSMDNNQLMDAINEIYSIIASRKSDITIIECDTEIQKVYKIKKSTDVDFNIKGRGGTSYEPVINYINNHKEYRDAVLIYFTDGYGDDEITKPFTYKNLWVITSGDYLSIKEPYGNILYLKDEK